jgi:hypothetical protein
MRKYHKTKTAAKKKAHGGSVYKTKKGWGVSHKHKRKR